MANDLESTNQLLRVMLALLLERSESHHTLRQKIDFLDRSGMKATEIGKILGKTANHVGKELTGIRKARK